ncbi:MAG: Ldh family oxidoreductase [Clostridiales bacterium]|jgi:LDH2 family malate/lactate/ureidoglycolate dehydrogenase|nr:Ldh family oxidoreductase [Clostridiales bacterium]MDR2750025.1 Ldh family oxidoreductase [Clostridiales bacterium]
MTAYESFETLESFMKETFVKAGIPAEDAATCAEVLIESDKRGIESHGIGRFKPIYLDRIKAGILNPVTKIEIVKEAPATAVIDGNDGMGHVIGKRSMELAIEKASKFGLGMVAAKNSSHYGIAGYYATMASKRGMIGITGTNARPSIAPTFGVENMLGTNPLTFGIPTDEDFDFVLDCATSVSQRGKIEVYDRIGKDVPSGWVIDHEGQGRTGIAGLLDELDKGGLALAPLGGPGEDLAGYKGYGYATVVEILSAALAAGPFLKALSGISADGSKSPYHLGHFFIAIDVTAFTSEESFRKSTGEILRQLRASRKAPGQDRIYTAGEKEYECFISRKASGVPLNEALQQTIKAVIKEYGVEGFKFSFLE